MLFITIIYVSTALDYIDEIVELLNGPPNGSVSADIRYYFWELFNVYTEFIKIIIFKR